MLGQNYKAQLFKRQMKVQSDSFLNIYVLEKWTVQEHATIGAGVYSQSSFVTDQLWSFMFSALV